MISGWVLRMLLSECGSLTETGMVTTWTPASNASCAYLKFGTSATTRSPGSSRLRHHLPAIRHLRQRARRHERADLDLAQSSLRQRRDPAVLARGRHDALDALQTVARPDLAHQYVHAGSDFAPMEATSSPAGITGRVLGEMASSGDAAWQRGERSVRHPKRVKPECCAGYRSHVRFARLIRWRRRSCFPWDRRSRLCRLQ